MSRLAQSRHDRKYSFSELGMGNSPVLYTLMPCYGRGLCMCVCVCERERERERERTGFGKGEVGVALEAWDRGMDVHVI